jgi:integrase
MGNYRGITTVVKNGKTNIMVRFKYLGKTYPVKNFTRLYGSKTQKSAHNKLNEIKILISEGKDPFISTSYNLTDIFKERIEKKRKSKEWSEFTISNYELFYEKNMKKKIGYKKLNKIKYIDLTNILECDEVIEKSSVWKNRLKQILNPLFKDALKKGEVYQNPCDMLENYNNEESENIYDKIIDNNILNIAQELYSTIPNYPVKSKPRELETKTFLYMVLLTAHRIGEVLKLTKEDCYVKHKKIISPKHITKQRQESEFPIPDECLEYIESIEEGKIFPTIQRASVYLMFQRLVKISNIEIRKGKILTIHDTRSLLLNILVENGVDSMLGDYTLDHKAKGTIKNYINFNYERKKEAYEIYWNLVRNDKLAIKKEEFRKEFFKNYEVEFEKAWKEKSLN